MSLQAKPENKHVPKSGFWKTEFGHTWWIESDNWGTELERYEPIELEGISKTASFVIIFVTDNNDINTLTGKTKKFWKQNVEVKLSETVSPNVYLRTDKNRIFVSDLEPLGQTFTCPLESQDWGLIANKTEPEPITQLKQNNCLIMER